MDVGALFSYLPCLILALSDDAKYGFVFVEIPSF